MGKCMTFDRSMAVPKITSPLFEKVGPEISQKVRVGNCVKLFDGANKKVRAWGGGSACRGRRVGPGRPLGLQMK
jgi:hypothetical protein